MLSEQDMNAALTPAQLLASLEWRYATKAFDTRKLRREMLQTRAQANLRQ